jgi:protein O-GlcNAc transferase
LLPPPAAATEAVRQAVLAADLPRAASLAAALPAADRPVWLGLLAILRREAPAAIRLLRPANQPKLLGVAYYLAGQHLLFRDQMHEAIRRDPLDFGPYYYLGRHYDTDSSDAQTAAGWFRRALERHPGHARSRSYLGFCLERLAQPEAAAAAYTATPSLLNSQLGLARLRLAAGQPAEALPYATRAIAIDPADPAAPKLAARIYTDLGRRPEAVAALETAARLAPADATIRYQLFRLYQANAETQKAATARAAFERLVRIYGTQPSN